MYRKAIKKLEEWVENHPEPDEALLFPGAYTPRQILEEAKKGTKLGIELAMSKLKYDE